MKICRTGVRAALAVCFAAAGACLGWAAESAANLDASGLALSGYDAVSYFQEGGPKMGEASIFARYEGATYWFATEENRARFEAAPERFAPAFGGWCAWAMLEGDKVEVDPMRYRVFDDKLLLFYDGFWGNTLKKWNRRAEEEGESALYSAAAENWKGISGK